MTSGNGAAYRLGDWSTDDLAGARMRARRDALEIRPDKETFLGETPEQAVRAHWDGQRLHYTIAYLALVVAALEEQVRREG